MNTLSKYHPSLALTAMNGTKRGISFRLFEGFTIGRSSGDLILEDDVKVSSVHAKVVLDNKGQLILVDQNSVNGFVIQQRRVKKIAMLPGVIFRLGNTLFRVHVDEAASRKEGPGKKTRSWKEKLASHIQDRALMHSYFESGAIAPFSPALMLDFIEGPQAEQKVTLGYGPREAGYGHLDIELIDPLLPEMVFRLSPGPGAVQIRDLTGGDLKVNNHSIEVTFLEEGDIISIGQNKIRIGYL